MGSCWTNFCSQKLNRRILATLGFNRTTCHTAEATFDVFRPVFEDHIISRRANFVWPSRSCDLTHVGWRQRKTIDALKDNIREGIGKIQMYTIDNVPKNWTDRVGYCMSKAAIWMKVFSIINRKDCILNKKRNLRKYLVVFLKQKKKVCGGPCTYILYLNDS